MDLNWCFLAIGTLCFKDFGHIIGPATTSIPICHGSGFEIIPKMDYEAPKGCVYTYVHNMRKIAIIIQILATG